MLKRIKFLTKSSTAWMALEAPAKAKFFTTKEIDFVAQQVFADNSGVRFILHDHGN